jgi:hypothetical protein
MMEKNMRGVLVLFLCLSFACENDKKEKKLAMIQSSRELGWEVLFDGSSFDNFRGYLSQDVFSEWTIKDKEMLFTPGKGGGKNIITRKAYTNFILSLEWKIEKRGNSGIFWSVVEDKEYPEAYQTGPEVQVLDNDNHADGFHVDGTRTAGSVYDMIAYPKEHVNPANEWNLCVLEINHITNKGTVTMNGKESISFPLSGLEWDNMVTNSKFKDWRGFRKQYTGHIGLQDHGNKVWFRNIKIKEL